MIRARLIATLLSAALALFLGCACASPLGGEDLELSLGASALPGAGALAGLSQRLWEGEHRRLDFEMQYVHQELADEGPSGDNDWDELRGGLRLRSPSQASTVWFASTGAVWLRARGEPEVLDAPDDYGGVYLDLGLAFALTPSLATGPDLSFLAVDAEGDRSGGGTLTELAWRIVWKL